MPFNDFLGNERVVGHPTVSQNPQKALHRIDSCSSNACSRS